MRRRWLLDLGLGAGGCLLALALWTLGQDHFRTEAMWRFLSPIMDQAARQQAAAQAQAAPPTRSAEKPPVPPTP